jgi:hypothetical protein
MTFHSRDGGKASRAPCWHPRGRELSATGIFAMVSLIGKLSQQLCSRSENIRYSTQLVLARERMENLGGPAMTLSALADCMGELPAISAKRHRSASEYVVCEPRS